MGVDESEELGPIDYLVVEWTGKQPTGEAVPHLLELVDSGLIRLIDLSFIAKDEDGSVIELEIAELGSTIEGFKELEGASSGLISSEDQAEAANALEKGSAAAILVYENRWAAPFASAMRRSGARLVANGRIPIQEIIAVLDESEPSNNA
ncbi:MAG: DUF1269 domain-containing protein [Solirubrobacterales bacterium]|nr:DUF1269 domain-containing protein [Solirubrobacterales bacterium]